LQTTVECPSLGEAADQGVIVGWLHSVGDHIQEGDGLASVEVGKVDVEVPSPVTGRLVDILVNKGDEVAVGAPICVVETVN
jgi:pyruvate dehydrogenase E2 component (dihydrolipoamide acetyltransferase)